MLVHTCDGFVSEPRPKNGPKTANLKQIKEQVQNKGDNFGGI